MIATSWRSHGRRVESEPAREPAPVIVAFQGERGAYGDMAIERRWGAGALRIRCWDFDGVVSAVASGEADFGVLPVHNVIVGEIDETRAAIANPALHIEDEVTVPVRHCVLVLRGVKAESLRELFSHPVALAQCTSWLRAHPSLRACAAYDTAGAAREVAARRRPWEGAIASEECATRYGLQVIARDIGDRTDNATRFAIVARRAGGRD